MREGENQKEGGGGWGTRGERGRAGMFSRQHCGRKKRERDEEKKMEKERREWGERERKRESESESESEFVRDREILIE